MSRVLIIEVSSSTESPWGSWQFENSNRIAFRIGDDGEINQYINIKAIATIKSDDKDIVIWINGLHDGEKEGLKSHLSIFYKNNDITESFVTYHDADFAEFHKEIEKSLSNIAPKYNDYGSTAFKEGKQFELIRTEGKLNSKASFDDFKRCFFLNSPDILSFAIHKINGIVGALSLDLQLLEESGFDESLLKELSEKWQQRKDAEKNLSKYINGDYNSLKKLADTWKISIEIELTEFNATLEILRTNEKEKEMKLRKQLPIFKEWCNKFLSGIDEFDQAVRKAEKEEAAKRNG